MEDSLTFPLSPRKRIWGSLFGEYRGSRRGEGHDIIELRPYLPGDPVRHIDHKTTARQSSFLGRYEPFVLEFHQDEAFRAVIVVDRSPRMSWHPNPWLFKREVIVAAGQMIVDSVRRHRGFVGYLDYARWEEMQEEFWRPPNQETEAERVRNRNITYARFTAPRENMTHALEWLLSCGAQVPPETFVFLISDFLFPRDERFDASFEEARVRWDLVPVIIQDPLLEASFPSWEGNFTVKLPCMSEYGKLVSRTISAREARERKAVHEERLSRLETFFREAGIEPVVLCTKDPFEILEAFRVWDASRKERRR